MLRARITALAVAFHVAAVVLLAIPAPPPGMRGKGSHAATDRAVASWARAAAAIGVPRPAFDAALEGVSSAQLALYGAVRVVFQPYARLVGAGQSWLMFGTVPDQVHRLEIDVHTADGWEPLYVARSDDAAWRRELFDQERMRTFVHQIGRKQANSRYPGFVAWVGREVAHDRPDVDRVRIRFRKVTIPPPDVYARTHELRLGGWILAREVEP